MILSQLQPLANHLWQSTLFAGAIGLAVLALRRYGPQARYVLWLAASAKFLLPFSILARTGSWFGQHTNVPVLPPISLVIQQVNEPFTAEPFSWDPDVSATSLAGTSYPAEWIAMALCTVWALGSLYVIFCWTRGWRRISEALRWASPAVASIDHVAGVAVLSSPAVLEPAVVGVFRPKLLLPQDMESHLSALQLQAILQHELAHVRRRDNLTGLIHRAAEVLFWFHPLVWWIGARLNEARERACDEAVLRIGIEPEIYGEAILKVCELYLKSPVPFVTGVTGSNLKTRMEEIMSRRIAPQLTLVRKATLVVAGLVALAVPVAVGVLNVPLLKAQSRAQSETKSQPQAQPPSPSAPKSQLPAEPQLMAQQTTASPKQVREPESERRPEEKPAFEVATIKLARPDAVPKNQLVRVNSTRVSIPSMTLMTLIYTAYGDGGSNTSMRVTGGPDWTNKTAFSIEGVSAAPATTQQQRLMLQTLLQERFALKVRMGEESVDLLALTVDRRDGTLGPKVKKWDGTCPGVMPALYLQVPRRPLQRTADNKFVVEPGSAGDDADVPYCPTGYRTNGGMRIDGATMATAAAMLSLPPSRALLGTITQDRTGLTDRYTMELDYPFIPSPTATADAVPDFTAGALSDAVREQWGLRLVRSKGPLKVILVESAQPPTEN